MKWRACLQSMSNRSPPLVQRWSNPVKVRLTEEGREAAKGILAVSIQAGSIAPVPGFDHAEVLALQRARQISDPAAEPKGKVKKKRKGSAEVADAPGAQLIRAVHGRLLRRLADGCFKVAICICMGGCSMHCIFRLMLGQQGRWPSQNGRGRGL
jgi:hypothetical protein